MLIRCAWCGEVLGEKPPYDELRITHGICPRCAARHFPPWALDELPADAPTDAPPLSPVDPQRFLQPPLPFDDDDL